PTPSQPGTPSPPPPPRPNSAGKTIALTLVGVLLVAGVAVGGYLAWDTFIAEKDADPAGSSAVSDPAETSSPADEDTADPEPAAEPIGWTTPEDALAEQMPQEWVYDTLSDDGEIIEYIIGPPNSEYLDVVVVARQPDDSWVVEDVHPYELGNIDADYSATPVDEAEFVVELFITAVAEDRADDAHAWTISPFYEDPASASFSNGDLLGFTIVDSAVQADGTTVWVTVDEDWVWNVERYVYVCAPTSDGYRITDVFPG
ncbi:MAG: hypothetical protein PF636_10965, partial [Actinomycetota bacterium]|nr:hypothetical protein [Actinomycetota bacterium]